VVYCLNNNISAGKHLLTRMKILKNKKNSKKKKTENHKNNSIKFLQLQLLKTARVTKQHLGNKQGIS